MGLARAYLVPRGFSTQWSHSGLLSSRLTPLAVAAAGWPAGPGHRQGVEALSRVLCERDPEDKWPGLCAWLWKLSLVGAGGDMYVGVSWGRAMWLLASFG